MITDILLITIFGLIDLYILTVKPGTAIKRACAEYVAFGLMVIGVISLVRRIYPDNHILPWITAAASYIALICLSSWLRKLIYKNKQGGKC